MLRLFIVAISLLAIIEVTQQHPGCEKHRAHMTNPSGSEHQTLDDLVDKLFKKQPNSTEPITPPVNPELPPGVPEHDRCEDGHECVVDYLCLNNTITTTGEGIIDARFSADRPRTCYHYMEVCCGEGNKIDKPNPPPRPNPTGCGYRNKQGIAYRISGSDGEAEYGEFPWMVAILKEQLVDDKLLNFFQCGGSLIHPKVVVTAAHCIRDQESIKLKVRAGEWDTQTKNEIYPEQDRDVIDIVRHPDYRRGSLHNDIALLILDEPFELEENVQTICLPPQNAIFDYSRCAASGWGKDQFGREGKYQVILKKIELPIVPHAACQDALRRTRLTERFNLHESFICAGGERGKDTCRGDGGSPLVCPVLNAHNRYYQSGIVAWGIGCGENQVPGVYVNVALFRDWIDALFAQRELDPSFYTAS